MKICFPVNEDRGMTSPLCAHFGAAPGFLFVDTETRACHGVLNRNQHHAHGQCAPLAALEGQQVDAMVVGGIGMGALMRLQGAGIQIFRSAHTTVAEALAAYEAKTLAAVDPASACQGHGHEHDDH